MYNSYDIYMSQKPVGKVSISKQGRYYQLECICKTKKPDRYEMVLICDRRELNLGICVPYPDGFGLKTRIKATEIENRNIRFELRVKGSAQKSEFYPVLENRPFAFLDQLEHAYLQTRDGQVGIVFRDQSVIESSSPTGQ